MGEIWSYQKSNYNRCNSVKKKQTSFLRLSRISVASVCTIILWFAEPPFIRGVIGWPYSNKSLIYLVVHSSKLETQQPGLFSIPLANRTQEQVFLSEKI